MKERVTDIGAKIAAVVLATALVVSVSVESASAMVVDRIVAQVNDEIVTLYDLEQAALPYLVQRGQHPRVLEDEERRDELLEAVLEDMVNRILLEEEAEERGVEVTDAQIEEWMQMTRQQQGLSEQQFRQMIGQYGIEYDDYREIVRNNLLRMQLMQSRGRMANVSRADVESEYRRRYGSSGEAQRRLELRHILLVPDPETGGEEGALERAAELRDQIEDGASFAELAEEHSEGPGSNDGGYLGTFVRGELAETFEDEAFALEDGELSEPVVTEFGVHLIEVISSEEVEDASVQQRKERIQMELQEREMQSQMQSYLQTLRARAFVDIRY